MQRLAEHSFGVEQGGVVVLKLLLLRTNDVEEEDATDGWRAHGRGHVDQAGRAHGIRDRDQHERAPPAEARQVGIARLRRHVCQPGARREYRQVQRAADH